MHESDLIDLEADLDGNVDASDDLLVAASEDGG